MSRAMMRARQRGRPCRFHGGWCEVFQERPAWTRTQEKRAWRREIRDA